MKIALAVSDESREELARLLTEKGIEIDDSAPLVLSERSRYPGHITLRDAAGEKAHLAVGSIVYLESFRHSVTIHAADGDYTSTEPLYQLQSQLDPACFVRVSNSVIIARDKVRQIRPTFSMKFVLKLEGGALVDVTRSYYTQFKELFGI